jgi:hypothetical protein
MMMIDTMGPAVLLIVLVVLVATLRHDPRLAERAEEDVREVGERPSRKGRETSRSGRRRRMSI